MFNFSNLNINHQKGFAGIAIVVAVAVIAVIGIGSYAVISRNDTVNDQGEQGGEQALKNNTSTTTTDASPPANENTESANSSLAQEKASARVVASHEFAVNPGFEPGKVNITCNVPTEMEVADILIYPGLAGQGPIGGAGTPPDSLPRSTALGAFKNVSYVYTQPGDYTITCVPWYPGDESVSFDSQFAGKTTITIGDTAEAENNFAFSFSPIQGAGTIDIDASCRANDEISNRVTGLSLMLDYPTTEAFLGSKGLTEDDLEGMSKEDQLNIFDEFLSSIISVNADSEGGVSEVVWQEMLNISENQNLRGDHTIYCVASFLDNTQQIIDGVDVRFEE